MENYSLSDLYIDGFRGLRGLTLGSLGQINILVGANNSGKTSVLEAISIVCAPLDPKEWLALARRRDFRGLDRSKLQPLRWCFRQSGLSADPFALHHGHCELGRGGNAGVRLTVDYAETQREPSAEERDSAGRRQDDDAPWRGARLTHRMVSSEQELQRVDTERSMEVWENLRVNQRVSGRRAFRIPTDTVTPCSYQISRAKVTPASRQMIVELIRKFDPNVLDIVDSALKGLGTTTYIAHSKLGLAPLYIFGDAFRRALLLATKIYQLRDGGVLLIDELETGIHVSVLGSVFAWLTTIARELGVQIIATTHSLEAVDGILKSDGCSANTVTYHLDQDADQTRAKRIPGELAKRLREERGLDIR